MICCVMNDDNAFVAECPGLFNERLDLRGESIVRRENEQWDMSEPRYRLTSNVTRW